VVITAAASSPYSRDDVRNDEDLQDFFGRGLRQILGLGVPFVCAAGNRDGVPINHLPALFQETNTPILVVGSNDFDGSRSSFSQLGPQLTIYAPGRDVEVQSRVEFQSLLATGTSYGK
jgi:hypothetical protein